MLFLDVIRRDWRANRGNPKALIVVTSFRIAHSASEWKGPLWLPGRIVGTLYRIFVEWILGVEIPWKLRAGPGLVIFHGQGVVINDGAVLGEDVVLRQGVTIGHLRHGGASPQIGDRVQFGANVVVVGAVKVGHDSRIGPGVVLTTDVDPGVTVVAPLPVFRERFREKPDVIGGCK